MSKAVPWRFDELSAEAREATQQAAREAGMSIGDLLELLTRRQADLGAGAGSAPIRAESHRLSEHVARTAVRMVEPDVWREVRRQFAATGTDGGATFPPGVILPGSGGVAVGEAFRNGTALQTMSDRLARFEERAVASGMAEPGSAAGTSGRMPSMRDTVAQIARRQALLDNEDAVRGESPARPGSRSAAPQDRDGSTRSIGALGEAVSALEARLASSRNTVPSPAPGRWPAEAPTAVVAMPDPAEADSAAFETLSRDLRQVMADIDRRAAPHPSARPAPDAVWEDIRALLDRFRPGAALDTLDQRVKDLSDKLEQRFEAPASTTLIESLSRRIEEMQASLKSAMPASDMRSLETLMRGVATRLEATREASADIQSLEDTVGKLAEKIEASRTPFDVRAVNLLEEQIGRLAERLERSEASLSSLDAVERSLSDLFTQVEQTRHAAIDAAETAARTAARDTLRAALQHPGVGRPADGTSQAVERVGQDVVDLRLRQEEAERRTQATLSNLHDTMGRLLGHIEAIDLAGRGGASPAAPTQASEPNRRATARRVAEAAASPEAREPTPPADRPASLLTSDPADSLIEPRPARGRVPELDLDLAGPSRATKVEANGAAAPEAAAPEAAAMLAEGPASFIAAARRAAQAAQASAAEAQSPRKKPVRPAAGPSKTRASALSTLSRAKAFLAERRRPMLLGLAGLVLLLGAVEIVKISTKSGRGTEVATSAPAVEAPAAPESGTLKAPPPARQPDLSPLSAPASGAPAVLTTAPAAPDKTIAASRTLVSPASSAPAAEAAPKAQPRATNPFLAGLTSSLDGLPEGLKTLANGGDAAAQYEVGLRLAEGRSVSRDPKAAVAWFQKAAAQGLAPAQYRVGSAYEKGSGETRDPALAMAYYGRAAEAGNIRAMHNLAVMAAEGVGGKPDYAKAATWFGKAASFGVRDSEFNLAILYARGLGIEQNLGKSYMWFAVAAAQGDDDAAKKRDDVGARLDAQALAAAKAAATSFSPATPLASANEVPAPAGGWDAAAPAGGRPSAGAKAPSPKSAIM